MHVSAPTIFTWKLLLKGFLCTLILILVAANCSSQLRQIYKDSSENNAIEDLSFLDASKGYVAFRDWIGYTIDSGKTFVRKPITPNNVDFKGNAVNLTFGFTINGVEAFSTDSLLVFGHYGLVPSILYSTNGGNNFQLVFHSQYNNQLLRTGIEDLCFPGKGKIGYAIDADRVLKSTDGGITWNTLIDAPGNYFDQIVPIDPNNIMVINNSHNIYRVMKISNGGSSWFFLNLPANAGNVGYASFISPTKGWLYMKNDLGGRLYSTTNGGFSWKLLNDPEVNPFDCNKFQFVNDSTGYAIEEQYRSLKTSDGGLTWEEMDREQPFHFAGYTHQSIFTLDQEQIWLGGHYGLLEMSTKGGGAVIPTTYFKIDTSGYSQQAQVSLLNKSKTNRQFQWWVNGKKIAETYDASYIHDIYHGEDTVTLIGFNGNKTDTSTKTFYFVKIPYPAPTVKTFSPSTGGKGTQVEITGDFFEEVKNVYFGDLPALSFTVNSRYSITAFTGNGANGSVAVSTATGEGSKAGYVYYPAPVINDFQPKQGPVGSLITITGKNFGNGINDVLVKVGGVKAEVVNASNDQLQVKLPAGANYQPLSVTVNHHTAISSQSFSTIFPSECGFTAKSFENPFAVASGSQPDKVKLADFDGDGKPDLFITHRDGISIVRNTSTPGNISTDQRIDATVGLFPNAASLADIDGDGRIDIAVASSYQANINVYLNNSKPGLLELGSIQTFNAGVNPSSLVLSDFDNDGKADLVLSYYGNGNNRVVIFRNASSPGMIRFVKKKEFLTGNGPNFLEANDLNGDGKTDLIVQTDLTFQFGIFKNTSELGEICFAPRVDYGNTVGAAVRFAFGDFNNDGKQDLAIVNNGNYSIPPTSLEVYQNTSTIDTIRFGPKIAYAGQTNPRDVAVTDFDGDGKLDLVVPSGFFNIISLYKNTSNGTALSFTDIGSYLPFGTKGMTGGDLDGDGKPEVVAPDGIFRNLIGTKGSIAGKDTAVCAGSSIQIGREAQTNHSYRWTSTDTTFNSTSSNPTIAPKNSGWYFVEVSNSLGCKSHDSIFVKIGVAPTKPDAGKDLSICRGDSVILAGNAEPGTTISWSSREGQTYGVQQVKISPANTTYFIMNSKNEVCSSKDTLFVFVYGIPPADAGPDKKSCPGEGTFVGNSISAGNSYNWTSVPQGFTSSLPYPAVDPTVPTYYILTESNGICNRTDTVLITPVNPPHADAGADTLYCPGTELVLGKPGIPGLSYLWSSIPAGNYSNNPQLTIRPSNDISYVLKVDNGGCFRKDTLMVYVIKAADAGPDKRLCIGNSLQIGSSGNAGSVYSWTSQPAGFSSTTPTPIVAPKQTISYIVSKTDGFCITKDTIKIWVDSLLIPKVKISVSDTNFCAGIMPVFSAEPDTGLLVSKYQWQKNGLNVGTNQKTYTPVSLQNGDTIRVIITVINECVNSSTSTSDPIRMTQQTNLPSGVSISAKTTVASGETVQVKAKVTNAGTNGSFKWLESNNGINWNQLLQIGDTINYQPQVTGQKLKAVYTSQNRCPQTFSDTSNSLEFTVTAVTAIGTIPSQETGIHLYPNPATRELKLTGLKISDNWQQLSFKNVTGQLIRKQQSIKNKTEVLLELAGYPYGWLWIEITGSNDRRRIFKILHLPMP